MTRWKATELAAQVSQGARASVPDWTREEPRRFWDPSRKLLLSIRRYQYWRTKSGVMSTFLRRLVVLRYRFWSVVTGAEIDLMAQIGGGCILPHPNGVVIHPAAKIGVNCLIYQQVTIGTRNDDELSNERVPVIEEHVRIYSGARILGHVRISAYATIGANSVVLEDVPEKATVVGAPARRIR